MKIRYLYLFLALLVAAGSAKAQQPSDRQAVAQPTYHITMVPGTITAINYHDRQSTEIGFQGSPLLPLAKGQAKVSGKQGRVAIEASFRNLEPAQKFGPEFLTYVLWAITPEGKANNLGEILLDGEKSKTTVTTSLQTFGLIVTAEPYFAVSAPSDAVVLENVVLPETTGTIEQMTAKYQQLGRSQYSYDISKTEHFKSKTKVPLEMEEARNAVDIANFAGASQYAPDAYRKAQESLTEAEALLIKGKRKELVQSARDATQNAADARALTVTRIEAEEAAQEKASEAERTARAQADAAHSAATQQEEEVAQEKAELAKKQAELDAQQSAVQAQQSQAQAQQAAAQAQQADADRQEAVQREQQAQLAAAQAQQAAAQAEQEKEQLRAALLEQFNRILPTTDTPRGLKVNLADVLFNTGKYDLRPPAREALAKFSGIVLAHPGLILAIEGYTDNVGTDTYNQTLSENRGNSVRAYLIAQGIDPGSITSMGFGKSNPVADNTTAAGKQQNRRVEIIISGEIIGTQIGSHEQSALPAVSQ